MLIGYSILSLTLYVLSKCSISAVTMTLHMYTSELYPTPHRHRLIAVSATIGRVGAVIAPLTPAFVSGHFITYINYSIIVMYFVYMDI